MIGAWLIAPEAFAEASAAASVVPTAAQIDALGRAPALALRIEGSTAHVSVVGVLSQRPGMISMITGGSTYEGISDQLSAAASDPSISRVEMRVDSPGGQVSGLFSLLAQLENFPKPIEVKASLAASAAYAIAAAAGPIQAEGPASVFGSIGVATRIQIDPSVRDIASTHAPQKRPDVTTPEGVAAVRSELDAVHELFADAIARGRKTTTARVNKDFGRGGTLLAAAAKKQGMVDSVSTPHNTRTRPATAELGPQQLAARALEQQLGSATARGASESQADYSRRLMAGIVPPTPKKPVRSAAEIVADAICGRIDSPEDDEPEDPNSDAACVTNAVIAAMRAGRES